MLPIHLTPAEIEQITDLTQPAAQARWLRAAGLTVKESATGRPIVSRMAWERLMGGLPPATAAQPDADEANHYQVKGLRGGNVVAMRR